MVVEIASLLEYSLTNSDLSGRLTDESGVFGPQALVQVVDRVPG